MALSPRRPHTLLSLTAALKLRFPFAGAQYALILHTVESEYACEALCSLDTEREQLAQHTQNQKGSAHTQLATGTHTNHCCRVSSRFTPTAFRYNFCHMLSGQKARRMSVRIMFTQENCNECREGERETMTAHIEAGEAGVRAAALCVQPLVYGLSFAFLARPPPSPPTTWCGTASGLPRTHGALRLPAQIAGYL